MTTTQNKRQESILAGFYTDMYWQQSFATIQLGIEISWARKHEINLQVVDLGI